MTGCATDRARLADAERAKAAAAVVEEAVAIGAKREPLPAQPGECRGPVRSGVSPADLADEALLKQDAALGRANRTLAACAAFYDRVRGGR